MDKLQQILEGINACLNTDMKHQEDLFKKTKELLKISHELTKHSILHLENYYDDNEARSPLATPWFES